MTGQRAFAAFLCALFTLLATSGCQSRPSAESAPPESAVAVPLFPEHPRLFMRKSDIPRIRETIAAIPAARSQYDNLLARANPDAPVAYPQPHVPTQSGWTTVVSREGGNAAQCGFAYQMTGDVRYAAWVKNMLLGWAREFDAKIDFRLCSDFHADEPGKAGQGGNDMGFYYSGLVLQNLAMAYDCIFDTLSPDERRTIEEGLFGKWVKAIESIDYHQRDPVFASDYMYNGGQWNGAINCNAGLTAVGLVLNDPPLYQRGIRSLKLYIGRDILSDGAWIEEDRGYADGSMASLFNVAWMAKSSGYPEDLFRCVVQSKTPAQYDHAYANTFVTEDGAHMGPRSLTMYLDSHLDYQYPNLAEGDWGWYPARRGSGAVHSPQLLGMYTIGYALFSKPEYGFILQHAAATPALGSGITSLLYFGRPVANIPPADTRSHVYSHARAIALKSIEGPAYWNSDSLYAFMTYGTERNKPIMPFSLDIFGYGRVLAPRLDILNHAQSAVTDYQATEPAWNAVLTDGENLHSLLRDTPTRSWMAWEDLGSLVKIVSPRIHWIGTRQAELYRPPVERHPEEDRTTSRILAMTDTYLVDVSHIAYDRRPKYHHNFDYVLHGYGKLQPEGRRANDDRTSNYTALWLQDGGIGLSSTVVGSNLGSGTKYKTYYGPTTDFFVASRAGEVETFLVVHEPIKGPSKLGPIRVIEETADHIAVEIAHKDGTVDFLAVRLEDTTGPYTIKRSAGKAEEFKGNYLFIRTHADGHEDRQAK